MRKFVFVFILTVFGGGIVYHAITYGWKSLFIPVNMKKIQGTDINELKDIAEDAEKRLQGSLKDKKLVNKVATSYEELGRAYLEKGSWSPAIAALEKAMKHGANGARMHHALGVAYANRAKNINDQQDVKMAEYHYNAAIEKNPQLLDSYYGMSILKFYLKNEKDEAIKILQNIITKDRKYFDARFALARFYYETGQKSIALSVYNELYSDLEKEPDSSRIKRYKKNCLKNIEQLRLQEGAGR